MARELCVIADILSLFPYETASRNPYWEPTWMEIRLKRGFA
jgi:hypothetical protein